MRLVGKQLLFEFARQHAELGPDLNAWMFEVEDASWQNSRDVKARYPGARIINHDSIIFHLHEHKYSIETRVSYPIKVVLVTQMGIVSADGQQNMYEQIQ